MGLGFYSSDSWYWSFDLPIKEWSLCMVSWPGTTLSKSWLQGKGLGAEKMNFKILLYLAFDQCSRNSYMDIVITNFEVFFFLYHINISRQWGSLFGIFELVTGSQYASIFAYGHQVWGSVREDRRMPIHTCIYSPRDLYVCPLRDICCMQKISWIFTTLKLHINTGKGRQTQYLTHPHGKGE